MTDRALLVACVVFLAFATESALGFGATVISVALGSSLMPVRSLLAALVPLNLALSAYLTLRYRRDIDRAVLLKRVLPLMLLGMPAGMLAASRLPESALKRVFGTFVLVLAVAELARSLRREESARPLPNAGASGLLLLGGAVHGMFGVGGPIAVYVASRWIAERARFRATLSALWLTLNAVFLVPYLRDGMIDAASLRGTVTLAPALGMGMVAGELAHSRVPEAAFKRAVYAMLLVAGAMLVARG